MVLAGGISAIKESRFEENTPVNKYIVGLIGGGGAIYATANSTLQILSSIFKRNRALKVGGAICFLGRRLVIISTLFEHNSAMSNYDASAFGGAVRALFRSTVEISNCSFKAIKATQGGGAISFQGEKLAIKSSLLKNNYALNKYNRQTVGGAVYAFSNSSVHVLNCNFKENGATSFGGAIHTFGKKLMIKFSLFERNIPLSKYTAETYGGAVSADINAVAEILSCSFRRNIATQTGSAVHTFGKKLILISSLFEHNTAASKYANNSEGGAVYVVPKLLQL